MTNLWLFCCRDIMQAKSATKLVINNLIYTCYYFEMTKGWSLRRLFNVACWFTLAGLMSICQRTIIYFPHADTQCSQSCKSTHLGKEYCGAVSQTRSGKTCQAWDSMSPHFHVLTNPALFPDQQTPKGVCRNPVGEPGGPWCHTTDPGTRWELCDIPMCGK